MALDWFNRDSLEGLAEGVNGAILALALSVQGAVEEAYENMEAMEQRLRAVEQGAVAVRYAGDGALEAVPVAGTGCTAGKGGEGADGNGANGAPGHN